VKRLSIFFGLAIAPFALAAEIPASLRSIYDAQSKQFAAEDWKGFFSHYDPAFVYTEESGKRSNLAEARKAFTGMLGGSTKRSITTKFTGCKIMKEKVAVSYVTDFSITYKGQAKPKKYREIATDVWRQTPGGWVELSCTDKSFREVKS